MKKVIIVLFAVLLNGCSSDMFQNYHEAQYRKIAEEARYYDDPDGEWLVDKETNEIFFVYYNYNEIAFEVIDGLVFVNNDVFVPVNWLTKHKDGVYRQVCKSDSGKVIVISVQILD